MFKKTLLCTILSLLIFAVPTLSFAQSEEISPAEVSATISQQIPALSEAEAMALLNEAVVTEDGQPLQVAVLSLEEMEETEGALWQYYVALGVARAAIWAAPKISSSYRVIVNPKTAHTILQRVTSTGAYKHVVQIAKGAKPHVGFGANLRNANNARWHIRK